MIAAGQKRPRPGSSDEADASNTSGSDMSIFRPPILRNAALTAAASLNKALFTSTYEIAAAQVHDVRLISKYQKALNSSKELLRVERLASVADVPENAATNPAAGDAAPAKPSPKKKCLLLRPGVVPSSPETWSDVLKQGVEKSELGVIPYQLTLNYDHWTSRDVLVSVLPEEFHEDIPAGFNTAGHVAHLNLRDRFKPYKHIVGEVLLDKNPHLRTVINKVDLVGTESVFRTFPYEVLAGPDDMDVEVRENGCTFSFDYSKVYWNSKLEPEHTRLLYLFKPGEVVVDLMAGIGPFAVPAGKRGVFVWANDMNPNSYEALGNAIKRNKAGSYVRPFNEDGLVFIHKSADLVRESSEANEGALDVPDTVDSRNQQGSKPAQAQKQQQQQKQQKQPAKEDSTATSAAGGPKARKQPPPRRHVPVPPTISHFVMNLPASAITFLPCFKGLYAAHEDLFKPVEGAEAPADKVYPKLPIVHTHCFAPKDDDQSIPFGDVRDRVSAELGVEMTLCPRYEDMENDDPLAAESKNLVYVHNVRAVAPHKSMYCASFRLPASVAFAPRTQEGEKKAEKAE
ncbi:tRNA(m(1)G37)methyltransferase [Sporothrix stenoceras]|uniref:tRNA (guanine(37)-N1)-methyltransferase n=1 Tax=Sporothrix stenoceras TaxID=5173 RepID=A0ABR3ZTL3_9PEZI